MSELDTLVAGLREQAGLRLKGDIGRTVGADAEVADDPRIRLGDDCAAIPDGDGHSLFAIEGLLPEFVAADPWFAGYSGVMVNLSDVAAMGGRPVAVVDAVWARDEERFADIWAGMAAASRAYNVPIVGGHTHTRGRHDSLAVAVLGRAGRRPLTSFDASPGDRLLFAVDLRGHYHEGQPFWDASTRCDDPERLRDDLELMATVAELGLAHAAKDVSMAGLPGTALMLCECSGVGLRLDLAAVPRPDGVPLSKWLVSFPSFGYLLAVRPDNVDRVRGLFAVRDLACADIGGFDETSCLSVRLEGASTLFWDWRRNPLMSFGRAAGRSVVEPSA
ncbi:MAG: sll0787 family AIR synthase-like protein [Planctomycetota bacterium]